MWEGELKGEGCREWCWLSGRRPAWTHLSSEVADDEQKGTTGEQSTSMRSRTEHTDWTVDATRRSLTNGSLSERLRYWHDSDWRGISRKRWWTRRG